MTTAVWEKAFAWENQGESGLVYRVNLLEMSRRKFSGRKKEAGASTQRTSELEEGKHRELEFLPSLRKIFLVIRIETQKTSSEMQTQSIVAR